MRTAIYIKDGVVQLVITPETEWEKNALSQFRDKPLQAQIFDGAFYDCRGGWVRQKQHYPHYDSYGSPKEDSSLILRIDGRLPETVKAESPS